MFIFLKYSSTCFICCRTLREIFTSIDTNDTGTVRLGDVSKHKYFLMFIHQR